jgi:rubrerythrin
MTLEDAIVLAIEYETKVRDSYVEAAAAAGDEVGKKIFKTLGDEEQGHIDYLNHKLAELKDSGRVKPESLETVVPPAHVISDGVAKLQQHLEARDTGQEKELLSKALKLEQETSNFYASMVDQLGEDGEVFARFVEIEKGHLAIVQAELDYHSQTGYFFDFQDFGMV